MNKSIALAAASACLCLLLQPLHAQQIEAAAPNVPNAPGMRNAPDAPAAPNAPNAPVAQDAPDAPWRIVGDIGVGVNIAPVAARAQSSATSAIPYLNFDYGPMFARIDTFGVKLLPLDAGSVELVTRALADRYTPLKTPSAMSRRDDSLPLGVGTLQVTSVGAFMANFYHDVGKSSGNLVDLMYAAEIDAGPVAIYPQVGTEYRSSAYVRYYDGVATASNNVFAALFAEVHLSGHWYMNANVRRTWLGKAIKNSPQVHRATLDANLLALSYRFN